MDKDEFWAKLDASDEEQIRQTVDLGGYHGNKKQWAEAWLNKQDRQRLNKPPWYETWYVRATIAIGIIVLAAYLSP